MSRAYSTIGTNKSTKVDRHIKFTFPDGAVVSSKVTLTTTFSSPNTRRNGRNCGRNPSHSVETMTDLMEAIAMARVDVAASEVEEEIRVEW